MEEGKFVPGVTIQRYCAVQGAYAVSQSRHREVATVHTQVSTGEISLSNYLLRLTD